MINVKQAKWMCCEDISMIRGYERAVNDNTQMYDLHHLEGVFYTSDELKKMGRYYKQPAMALIFLTKSEHQKIHGVFRDTSMQTRKKLSESHVNHKKLSKPVRQYDKDGVFIQEYPSTREVNRIFGYCHSHIQECCNGKRKQAYGYIWRYSD